MHRLVNGRRVRISQEEIQAAGKDGVKAQSRPKTRAGDAANKAKGGVNGEKTRKPAGAKPAGAKPATGKLDAAAAATAAAIAGQNRDAAGADVTDPAELAGPDGGEIEQPPAADSDAAAAGAVAGAASNASDQPPTDALTDGAGAPADAVGTDVLTDGGEDSADPSDGDRSGQSPPDPEGEIHDSDCSIYNGPALEPGACDCRKSERPAAGA